MRRTNGMDGGIAVIGMSGRYPGGAETPGLLWENLKAGIDGVTEVRGDRWDLGYHHPDPTRQDRVYTRACGVLEHIDGFDNEFFGLSPREARQVDPQQRLLLELAWEALEDAAIPLDRIAGTDAGVFIGISSNDYANLIGPGGPDAYSNTGSSFSIAANRISYFLDLHGPSVALDTACSSTIVGVHQACSSLRAGDCSIALVGGISLLVDIRPWIGFAKASMLSPTGRCKSFDASGDGYVRSEGGGIVVLKPLDAAVRDGDSIYGVIVGSGVNSDGHTLGLSMPNVDAQERLLRSVYAGCGVAPEDVVYVEAHGTGTAVGDPIECESIARVLGTPRTDGSDLLIGSVKSNIGHLEAASGMAGLTKALLALRNREIPGNLHFNEPNPKIPFADWKLSVVTETTPLPEREKPLVVGVNSFGFGGTNAHLAISEYRSPASAPPAAPGSEDASHVLLLSAHTSAALKEVAKTYVAFLRRADGPTWPDVCAAAALSRSRLRHRLALDARSASEAANILERFARDEMPPRLAVGSAGPKPASVAFVYSGNGPQWWGMGRELLQTNAEFRREIEAIDAVFVPLAGWSLVDEMRRPESESRTALTEYAQPLLFALQVALSALLKSAGIAPAVTLGHSVGEVAAAYVSGALSLEDAACVIYIRSMQQARTAGLGTMAALGVAADEALEAMRAVPGWLELAASNAPRAVTVAGDPVALETLRATLTDAGKFARVLALQYPFHTSAMDIVKDDLIASLATLHPRPAAIPFVSTVDVGEKAGEDLGAEYWWRNVREPVRFYEAVDLLIEERGIDVFLEIGPHPVLRDYVAQCVKAREKNTVAFGTLRRPTATREESDVENLATAISSCRANGAGSLEIFRRPSPMPALPHYPWQRSSHWRGTTVLPDVHQPTARAHPLLGYAISGGDGMWENTLDTNRLQYLRDHVVQGAIVFPAAGYIECAFAAARTTMGEATVDVEAFEVLRPLTLPDHTDPLIQSTADAKDGSFQLFSRADKHAGAWSQHVRGRVSRSDARPPAERLDVAALRARLPDHVGASEHYEAASRRGLEYGPAFQGVRAIWLSDPDAATDEALAEIDLSNLGADAFAPYSAHPALVDAAFQVILTLIGRHEPRPCSIIPVFVERARSYAPVPAHFFCSVVIVRESERSAVANFELFDTDGVLVAAFSGTRCQKVDFARGSASSLIVESWRPDPRVSESAADSAPLPLPAQLVPGLAERNAGALRAFGREAYYREIRPAFDRLVGAYAARALEELGATAGPFDLERLAKRGRVKAHRRPVLAWLLEIAEADGRIIATERGWTWNADAPSEAPEPLWRGLYDAHPRYISELLLVDAAGRNLVALVRESAEAGDDRADALDRLYECAPLRAAYHALAADAFRSFVETWPHDRPMRVLELAGGSGALTAALLPVLAPGRTDYVFADPSEASVARAEHRFARFPFVRFATLDVDRPIDRDGAGLGSFDIVVADNALHASEDAGATALANARALLEPGGLLLALESGAGRVQDLLFGRGAGRVLRGEAATCEALARAGFVDTAALSDRAAADGDPQQTIYFTIKPSSARTAENAPASDVPARHVLVLADPSETSGAMLAALSDRLVASGHTVTVRAARDAAADAYADADSIVFLAGAAHGAAEAVHLVHALEATRHDRPPQLTFVTRGALASPFGGPREPDDAALFGLARVVANEYSGLGCRTIDVHADPARAESGAWLAAELLRRDDETEVLLHEGLRYVNRERLTSLVELGTARAARPYRLDFVPQGGLDSLHVRSHERRDPQPHEVEIRIAAAGLNFRDVLWAMGMLPEEAVENGFSGATIGMECAGEIVRVGADVRDLQPGDRVIAFASSCFASHVTTDAGSVARMPEALDFAEAATIPIAFLTAYYALDELARLAPGETVLIHGAAGGVGLAAVQIAKLKGARVIGTAGSEAKRRLLELARVDHVLDSRSLEFADEVMRLTGGAGVDVVLNSLAGEAIAKGLAILRPFGRFLEIGKRDLYANSKIGLRPFRANLSYFGIDADTLLIERPDLARKIFAAVTAHLASGALRPIPFQVVPVSRAAEAFRTMQQAKHVGKIVVTMPADAEAVPMVRSAVPVRPDGTYLVTGGLGGFGLSSALWLAGQGARSIALVGRRGAVTDEAKAGIAALEGMGATVRAFAADVADPIAVDAMLASLRAEMAPLCGIIHSAAVIEDAPIMNVTDDLLARVWEPKARGAWNLHRATLQDPIETFVLYSSVSAMIGNPGQGAYVAANMALEALAQYRRAMGLPALAVGWGAIADAGFLTRNSAVADMLKHRSGLDATPAADALAELGRLLAAGAERVCVARYNLQRLGQMLAGARVPRFMPLVPADLVVEDAASETLRDRLEAAPRSERRGLIVAHVCRHAARVLGTSASQIEVDRPLAEMGLDSLMAVELAEAVERDVAQPISVMQMLGAGTIGAIADLVLRTLGLGDADDDGNLAKPAEREPAHANGSAGKTLVASGA